MSKESCAGEMGRRYEVSGDGCDAMPMTSVRDVSDEEAPKEEYTVL
jgi:hypothetical protein